MSDRIHKLPLVWMAIVVFGTTYIVTGAIYATEQAGAAVSREAGALKTAAALAASLPAEARLRGLIRRHIEETATQEWPASHDRPFVAEVSVGSAPLLEVSSGLAR